MKIFIYILSACLLVFVSVTTMNAMGMGNVNKLSGNIEFWPISNFNITKIDLSTGKVEEIFSQHAKYSLYDFDYFDVSSDGKERVFFSGGANYLQRGLLLLTHDKELKTILKNSSGDCPSFSPDGKYIAYLSITHEKKRQNWVDDWYLCLVKIDGTLDKQISRLSYQRAKPSWFPDGKKIAVGSKDLGIYIIDSETGKEKKIIDFGKTPAVSHNGKKIVYLSKDVDTSVKARMVNYQKITVKEYQDIYMKKKDKREERHLATLFNSYSFFIYDLDSGKSKKITEELFVESSKPIIWSPDDKYILYTDRKWEHHEIYALNIETGERQKVTSIQGIAMGWR